MTDPTTEQLLQGLNARQREAVQTTEGPLLIVAGAGSGKTRVLTQRIAYLLHKKITPFNILAITFTNKAAREMQERVAQLAGSIADEIWISTFHSMCVRILRRNIDRLGYSRNFSILDTADQRAAVKECLKQLNIDPKKFDPGSILGTISGYKNELKTPQDVQKRTGHYYDDVVADVYEAYQALLRSNQALDFDDLIMLTVRLFQQVPEVLEYYQRKFQYIHVDEYQDTNRAQYMLVRMLAERHRNICVVGDGDQSIYRFRGADVSIFLSFEQDYPEARVIKLEQNYRSTKRILHAANEVIKYNKSRKEKQLWTENEEGQKIHYYHGQNEHDEAYYVTETIREAVDRGRQYKDFAVLYRTNAQSRVIEEVFVKANIPYQMVGGTKFYDRKEIKDMLAYLRLIANPDDDLSFRRVVNVPKRGIGQTTVDKLGLYALEKGLSMYAALAEADFIGLQKRAVNQLLQFRGLVEQWRKQADDLSVMELAEDILERSGYRTALTKENTLESKSRLENLEEFLSVALEFDKQFDKQNEDNSLQTFLDELALVSDIDQVGEDENHVLLMTLHAAKGLEFPCIFLIGMEEGLFPHARSMMDETEMEEERRLAYVGMTRAREALYLTNARMRTIFGQTNMNPASRFIQEIPEDLLETVGDTADDGVSSFERQTTAARGHAPSFSQRGGTFQARRTVSESRANHQVLQTDWQVGDKAKHKKWGEGTVVSLNGEGDDLELTIAFPQPTGLKRLLARFAPIEKSKG